MSQNQPISLPPQVDEPKIAIVAAEWNGHIIDRLVNSALNRIKELGYPNDTATVARVPGTVELTFGASHMIEASMFDAVIVFGVVIRGETPHFDYVCQSVTQGVTNLNADCDTPVIFGVLTVENEEQALDRTEGGRCGDKGAEAVDAALKMINFVRTY